MWIQPIDQLRISIRMLHSIAQLSILHLTNSILHLTNSILHLTNCKIISLSYSISKFGLTLSYLFFGSVGPNYTIPIAHLSAGRRISGSNPGTL